MNYIRDYSRETEAWYTMFQISTRISISYIPALMIRMGAVILSLTLHGNKIEFFATGDLHRGATLPGQENPRCTARERVSRADIKISHDWPRPPALLDSLIKMRIIAYNILSVRSGTSGTSRRGFPGHLVKAAPLKRVFARSCKCAPKRVERICNFSEAPSVN